MFINIKHNQIIRIQKIFEGHFIFGIKSECGPSLIIENNEKVVRAKMALENMNGM